MRTVEIDEEVLDSMFEHIEYLHTLVKSVLKLLNAKKTGEWLTSKEVAKMLRISTATLHNLKQYGKIPFTQIEGRIMFLTDDIANYLLNQRVTLSK